MRCFTVEFTEAGIQLCRHRQDSQPGLRDGLSSVILAPVKTGVEKVEGLLPRPLAKLVRGRGAGQSGAFRFHPE